MEIQDLFVGKYEHCPVLGSSEEVPEVVDATYVGWLGATVPTIGKLEKSLLNFLGWCAENRKAHTGDLGDHDCEVCGSYSSSGEILFEVDGHFFVCPKMIVHYVEAHHYLPPTVFLQALDRLHLQTQC